MHSAKTFIPLALFLLLALGCAQLPFADPSAAEKASRAAESAKQAEEKAWAMVLRMEELTQRLEDTVKKTDAAAYRAVQAAKKAERWGAQLQRVDRNELNEAVALAQQAAAQADASVGKVEAQQAQTLQKVLELLRDLGYEAR